jgi:hypothetical protein
MKLIMKGSTGAQLGTYELGKVDSPEYGQKLMEALRDFATYMQDKDTLEVVGQYEEEML